MKTTAVFHSADWDGRFCEAIARKFLPKDTEFIGWDFTDKPLAIPSEGTIYVMDLPVDRVFGINLIKNSNLFLANLSDMECENAADMCRLVWIDHHKSSIESHPTSIPGYRIDGVAACRLCWAYFTHDYGPHNPRCHPSDYDLPQKGHYLTREVDEPLAVRLAGEYDVWDHRGDGDLEFQFGLDSQEAINWDTLLGNEAQPGEYAKLIVSDGKKAMACYAKRDADVMRTRSFTTKWEGLTFLCLNTPRCNSNTFAALDKPETGHDALMAFAFTGEKWVVSMYHAAHRKDLDLSEIAKKHGGGGHRGACGFTTTTISYIVKNS